MQKTISIEVSKKVFGQLVTKLNAIDQTKVKVGDKVTVNVPHNKSAERGDAVIIEIV